MAHSARNMRDVGRMHAELRSRARVAAAAGIQSPSPSGTHRSGYVRVDAFDQARNATDRCTPRPQATPELKCCRFASTSSLSWPRESAWNSAHERDRSPGACSLPT
jgi:hypothetical protein